MRRVHVVLIVLVCLLAVPAVAGASGRSVVRDCTDNGRIDTKHSQGDYKSALGSLPSDVDEYTDCRQIIEQAKRRDASSGSNSGGNNGGGSGGSSGGGGTGGSFGNFDSTTPPPASNIPAAPSAAEQSALTEAGAAGAAPVQVAGEPITPGGTGITEASFRHDVPGPLLVLVILLGLGALAVTVSGGRARGLKAPGSAHRAFDRVFPRRA